MTSKAATEVILKARECRSTVEFVTYLATHFLILSPGRDLIGGGSPVSEYDEVRRATEKIGRADLKGAVEEMAVAHQRATACDRSYIALVCAGLCLLQGDLDRPVDWYVDALGSAMHEEDDVWWATHAAVLGLCMCAARFPPRSWSPFTETNDEGMPSDKLLEFLGTFASWAQKGSREARTRREEYEVFRYAAAAIYHAVASPLFRAASKAAGHQVPGDLARLLDSVTIESDGIAGRAEEVDRLTGGDWRFGPWVRTLRQHWAAIEEGVGRD